MRLSAKPSLYCNYLLLNCNLHMGLGIEWLTTLPLADNLGREVVSRETVGITGFAGLADNLTTFFRVYP